MVFLLCLSAFFSGSETAFFSLRIYDLKRFSEGKNPLHRLMASLLSTPHKLLITILFCNMIVNLLFFSLSLSLEQEIARVYGKGGLFMMSIITVLLVIIFGEVTPKAIALTIPQQIAYFATLPLTFIQAIFSPLLIRLESLSLWILSYLKSSSFDHPSVEELKDLLESSGQKKLLTSTEIRLVKEALDLDSIQVSEVMIPRVKVMALDLNNFSPPDFREFMAGHRHTYYPAYESTPDQMVGLLDGRDFMLAPSEKRKEPRQFLEKPLFVSEFSSLSFTLDLLREKQTSIALAVDEYGGFAGVITLEDIVEEIFGEFRDEFDPVGPPPIKKLGPNKFEVQGHLPLRELAEVTGVPLEYPKVSTVNGLITSLRDTFPKEGDQVEYEKFLFLVLKTDKRSVETALVEIRKEEEPSENKEGASS